MRSFRISFLFLAVAWIYGPALQAFPPAGMPRLPSPPQQAVPSSQATLRQCNGVFFNREFSAWFNVDCLVPAEKAETGAFIWAEIPGVGRKQLWIVQVYPSPKLDAPTLPASQAKSGTPSVSAVVRFYLPAGASLTVNGKQVSAAKTEITVSNLIAGEVYEYHLRVVFPRDGQTVTADRMVAFSAGDKVEIDFTTPATTEAR